MSDTVSGETADARRAGDYESWTEHWTKRVGEWQASGLSQLEFCRQRSIKATTFNFWKLRVLKQAPGAKRYRKPRTDVIAPAETAKPRRSGRADSAPFLPVVVRPNTSKTEWWCEIACRNGRCLRLREAISEAELKALLSMLES